MTEKSSIIFRPIWFENEETIIFSTLKRKTNVHDLNQEAVENLRLNMVKAVATYLKDCGYEGSLQEVNAAFDNSVSEGLNLLHQGLGQKGLL